MQVLPLDEDDEVVSATRYAREGATSTEEQVIVITRLGDVFSLTLNGVKRTWTCQRLKVI